MRRFGGGQDPRAPNGGDAESKYRDEVTTTLVRPEKQVSFLGTSLLRSYIFSIDLVLHRSQQNPLYAPRLMQPTSSFEESDE
jgi:hypothetical protein